MNLWSCCKDHLSSLFLFKQERNSGRRNSIQSPHLIVIEWFLKFKPYLKHCFQEFRLWLKFFYYSSKLFIPSPHQLSLSLSLKRVLTYSWVERLASLSTFFHHDTKQKEMYSPKWHSPLTACLEKRNRDEREWQSRTRKKSVGVQDQRTFLFFPFQFFSISRLLILTPTIIFAFFSTIAFPFCIQETNLFSLRHTITANQTLPQVLESFTSHWTGWNGSKCDGCSNWPIPLHCSLSVC